MTEMEASTTLAFPDEARRRFPVTPEHERPKATQLGTPFAPCLDQAVRAETGTEEGRDRWSEQVSPMMAFCSEEKRGRRR